MKKKLFHNTPCNNTHQVQKQSVVKASYHQGDSVFPAESRGHQCTAMAASAAVYRLLSNVSQWERADLDPILMNGDKLYRQITSEMPTCENGYLLISDIPNSINLFDKLFIVNKTEPSFIQVQVVQQAVLNPLIFVSTAKIFSTTPNLKKCGLNVHVAICGVTRTVLMSAILSILPVTFANKPEYRWSGFQITTYTD